MSVVLAIDTASSRLQLALIRADGHVDVSVEEMQTGHAEALFPSIGVLLARNGLGYDGLARIAVTTGPGAFTGLRVGLAAARGLGLALAVPVIGIPNLLAIRLAAPLDRPCAVVIDARRGEAYFELFGPGLDPVPARTMPLAEARLAVPPGAALIEDPVVDVVRLAKFAAGADPVAFPPHAAYVRPADAKPQAGARIARTGR